MRILRLIAEAFAAEIRKQTLDREREIIEARIRAELEATHNLRASDWTPHTAPTAQKLN